MRSGEPAKNGRGDGFASGSFRSRAGTALRVALGVAVLVALLPFGSTGAFAGDFAAFAFASLAAATALLVPRPVPVAGAIRWAILCAAAVAGYVFLQTLPAVPWLPGDRLWEEAGRLLGTPLAATVSAAPAVSLATIPVLTAPFLAFASALWLLRSDEQALAMLRFLAYAGGLIAIFGLLQFALSPESLLTAEKRAYLDSVTTVFVNRNSAATYLGVTIVLLSALVAIDLRGMPLKTFFAMLLAGRRDGARYRRAFEVALIAICAFALILTKSRAGIASTILALTTFAALAIGNRNELASRRRLRRLLRPVAGALCALVFLGIVFLVFGGRTILRAQSRGLSDGRFCNYPDIWAATRDAWPFGTGAGTFALVFPQYRNAECGIYGVWDRAHQFFLEGAMTIGIAMPILCAIVFYVLLRLFLRGLRARRRYRAVPAAGIAVLLLVTVHDMVDFSLQIPGIALSVAVLLGAACAVSSLGTTSRRRVGKAAAKSTAFA